MAVSEKRSARSQGTEKENVVISYDKWTFLGKTWGKDKSRLKKIKRRKTLAGFFTPKERF